MTTAALPDVHPLLKDFLSRPVHKLLIDGKSVDAAAPWGGVKQSGYGREKGQYALENYTSLKSVWVDLN